LNYLHTDLGVRRRGELVQVDLAGSAANVLLMDSTNLSAFKAGRQHRYVGGLARSSPVVLSIPSAGHWHVVVHMAGLRGQVNASVHVVSP
jgi:hypothetical protein